MLEFVDIPLEATMLALGDDVYMLFRIGVLL